MGLRDAIIASRPSLFWIPGDRGTDATVRDLSGNGRHGTYTSVASGQRGDPPPFPGLERGVRFNNSAGYIERAYDSVFDIGTGDLAVEIWCYMTGKSGGAIHPLFVRDNGGSGAGINCVLQEGAGNTFIFRAGGLLAATSPVTTDRPHQFVFTKIAQQASVYMDRRRIGGPATLASTLQTGAKIQVGREDGGTIALGGMYAVAFWHTRGLTPGEIDAHHRAGFGLELPRRFHGR